MITSSSLEHVIPQYDSIIKSFRQTSKADVFSMLFSRTARLSTNNHFSSRTFLYTQGHTVTIIVNNWTLDNKRPITLTSGGRGCRESNGLVPIAVSRHISADDDITHDVAISSHSKCPVSKVFLLRLPYICFNYADSNRQLGGIEFDYQYKCIWKSHMHESGHLRTTYMEQFYDK